MACFSLILPGNDDDSPPLASMGRQGGTLPSPVHRSSGRRSHSHSVLFRVTWHSTQCQPRFKMDLGTHKYGTETDRGLGDRSPFAQHVLFFERVHFYWRRTGFASVRHLWCQPLAPHLNWLPASILPDSAGLYLCDLTLSGNDVRRATYGRREAPHLACVYLAALNVTGQVWPCHLHSVTMQLRFFPFSFFLFVCSTYCYSQGKAGV